MIPILKKKCIRIAYLAGCILNLTIYLCSAQSSFVHDKSPLHPYGQPNPNAPEQITDYAELIGVCDCKSISRNGDGTWADTVHMEWKYSYIMDGMAVQDETLKSDGRHSGSIRQYNVDSSAWYVHYYSSSAATPLLSAWKGQRKGNEMLLYKDQTAPNGTEGWFKIRFYDISEEGFNWLGAWVNKPETFTYETWQIFCTKRKE